jgi:Tfp pilus assembly protein PilV
MLKAFLLTVVGLLAVAAVLQRRRSQADAALWREATSDSSR